MRQPIPKGIPVQTRSVKEATDFGNDYVSGHLIFHLRDAKAVLEGVQNVGSAFVGPYSPERWVQPSEIPGNHHNIAYSCGDHTSGTNYTSNKRIRSPVQRGPHPSWGPADHSPTQLIRITTANLH